MNTIPWRTSGPLLRASLATLGTQSRVETFKSITVRKNRLSFTYEFRFVFQLGSPMLKVVATEVEVKTTTCKLPQLPPLPWQHPRPEGQPVGQLPPPPRQATAAAP